MPTFYFTVHDEWGEAADTEGSDLAGADAAVRHAVAGARSLMSDSVKQGKLDLSAFIDIEDRNRAHVSRLGFDEAVTITAPRPRKRAA